MVFVFWLLVFPVHGVSASGVLGPVLVAAGLFPLGGVSWVMVLGYYLLVLVLAAFVRFAVVCLFGYCLGYFVYRVSGGRWCKVVYLGIGAGGVQRR